MTKVGGSKVTLQSIADRVGVSRMTVSNAFSRPDQLSADLRTRILRTAEELGYGGPDPAARALASGRTGSVGLLMTDRLRILLDDDFSGEFLAAISEELASHGTALTLLTPGEGAPMPGRDVAMDGIVVYACRETSEELAAVRRRGIPIVTVDQVPVDDAGSVNVDDTTGARLAAEHVVQLGHRRVGILTSSPVDGPDEGREDTKLPGRERMAGWREVLDAAGIVPLLGEAAYLDADSSYEAARAMLDRDDPPTALLCIADSIAIPAMQAARDLGLRVPDDLSVVGYDDSRSARTSTPPLTTVRQDVNEKGRRAAAMLVAAIGRADAVGEPERFLLPVSLVVRESTAPPP